MSGVKSGATKQILIKEKSDVYMYCFGLALNLASLDAIKGCKITKDALDSIYELIKLIQFLPKWEAIFDKIKDELAPGTAGIKVICQTSWTVRGESLHRIIANYSFLQTLFNGENIELMTLKWKSNNRCDSLNDKFDFFLALYLQSLF